MPVSELGHRVVTPGDTHTFYVENLETPLGEHAKQTPSPQPGRRSTW